MTDRFEWKEWTPTKDDDGKLVDPYVHWWQKADGSSSYARDNFPVKRVDSLQFLLDRLESSRDAQALLGAAELNGIKPGIVDVLNCLLAAWD